MPLVSAVQIDPGTIIQSSGLNLTFNFTSTAFADSFSAETNAVYFNNFRRTGTEYITMNHTQTNANYFGVDLPYFSSSSPTSKTISSNLGQAINGDFIVSITNCNFKARYKNAPVQDDSCANGQATFNSLNIPPGNSELTFEYVSPTCEQDINTSSIFIMVFMALAIMSLSLILVYQFNQGNFSVQLMMIVFIGIMVGIAMFINAANSLTGVCN